MAGVWFLACHFVGDYLLQNTWLATRKIGSIAVAAVHALLYTLPYVAWFLIVYPTAQPGDLYVALYWVFVTHWLIDLTRAPKYFIWAKDQLAPRKHRTGGWHDVDERTGYPVGQPQWLSTWLLIITDNTLHLLCNLAAAGYIGAAVAGII